MKKRDIFDLAVRITGLFVMLYGLGHLLYGVLGAARMFKSDATSYNGVFGVCEIAFGLLMVRGFIPLADIAFPSDSAGDINPAPTGDPDIKDEKDPS